jgi:hypothetical protein
LGATCSFTDEDGNVTDLPKNIRLISNLTQDVPKYGLKLSKEMMNSPVANFNFVMMVNNFNNPKEFDVPQSNLRSLKFACIYDNGNYFGASIMDLVIELEILITR